ncbi:MAG TPA: hypothetical protein DHN29_03435, partial [Cytophagales bacterium]|nr:hypothetical protein [Cytophagales bacterium]
TPGEVVLNEEQISSLEQYVGAKRNKIFSDIGVPGFNKGGKVEPVEHDEGYPKKTAIREKREKFYKATEGER